MDEVINKAAKANYIADRMIIEITETRDKYDAAQAFPDSSIIYEIENNSYSYTRLLQAASFHFIMPIQNHLYKTKHNLFIF